MSEEINEESKPNQVVDATNRPYKILIMGHDDANIKEILINFFKITQDTFMTKIGVDFVSKYIEIEGNQVKFQFWYTAGQSKFRSITQAYYRGAHGSAFIFDLSKNDTFDLVVGMMKSIEKDGKLPFDSVLIGNNQGTEKLVTKEEIDQLTTKLKVFIICCYMKKTFLINSSNEMKK